MVPKNEHWENYWSLCYPCDIDYDYILKLETIEEDSTWLFNKLGLKNIVYPTGNSKPSNYDLLEEYLKGYIVNRIFSDFRCSYIFF